MNSFGNIIIIVVFSKKIYNTNSAIKIDNINYDLKNDNLLGKSYGYGAVIGVQFYTSSQVSIL